MLLHRGVAGYKMGDKVLSVRVSNKTGIPASAAHAGPAAQPPPFSPLPAPNGRPAGTTAICKWFCAGRCMSADACACAKADSRHRSAAVCGVTHFRARHIVNTA